jgi:hypothetical protein
MVTLKDLGLSPDTFRDRASNEERCDMCKGIGKLAVPGTLSNRRRPITCGVCGGKGIRPKEG